MGCTHSKREKELITIDQLEKELIRFQKNIRGYRRRKVICLKKIKSAKSGQNSTPSSCGSGAGEEQKDAPQREPANISSCHNVVTADGSFSILNMKQNIDVSQREPVNTSFSHSVVTVDAQEKEGSPSCSENISEIKQDIDVPQREPANTCPSFSVVTVVAQEKEGSPSCNENISEIKQDIDVSQREPADTSSSHSVVTVHSQKSVQRIPEDEEIRQSYNPIQNYNVIKQIGAGAFGQVYLAEHKYQGGEFAIKTVPLGSSESSNTTTEVEILKKCNHPNILRLQEDFWCNDNLCIVTEFVRGLDLYTISTVAKGFLINERLVSHIMSECLQGLAYLHQQKIIHCDFKSANILVGMNGQVKIADFGLSEQEDGQIIPGFRGTLSYAAPEMANGRAFDSKVDIWGLGVVAIEFFQGYSPLESAPTEEDAYNMCKYGCNAMSEGAASRASRDFMDFLYNGALIQNPSYRLSANQLLRHRFITSSVHDDGDKYRCLSMLLEWVKLVQQFGPLYGHG